MRISIINSKGHWQDGWLPNQETLHYFQKTLNKSGIQSEAYEVDSQAELKQLLPDLDSEGLILPNAYKVYQKKGGRDTIWMADVLEKHRCKTIGSGAATLKKLFQKETCQQILKDHGVPVPLFTLIHPGDLGKEKGIITEAGLTYPIIIKLTQSSCGVGISEDSVVNNDQEAIRQIRKMISDYGQSLLLETLLPGKEVTAARFQIGDQALHLATYYEVENHAILGYNERQIPWGSQKKMTKVEDQAILAQINHIYPILWKALGIKDIIRIDGKLDPQGTFTVFDVNGFPGLIPNRNTFTVQCNTCFSHVAPEDVYGAMVNTIILAAAHRYQIPGSPALEKNNLFAWS